MTLFKTFKSWQKYFLSAIKSVFVGIIRIVWSIILGIASVAVFVYRKVNDFCRREFVASLVIALLFCVVFLSWLGTFVNERSARVRAEEQRDMLSLKLDSARQNAFFRPQTINHCDEDE